MNKTLAGRKRKKERVRIGGGEARRCPRKSKCVCMEFTIARRSKALRLVLATGLFCLLCLPELHRSPLQELLESPKVFSPSACTSLFFFQDLRFLG